MPIKILSCDFLIADVIVNLEGNPRLAALVEEFSFHAENKYILTKEQFDRMSAAVEDTPITVTPGGSSANLLSTLAKLMPGEVHISFIGIAGDGFSSNMIKKSLAEAQIRLLPEKLPKAMTPKTAMSYVIRLASGQRIIATYPGNARDLIKPEIIDEQWVKQCDVLLLQGALWQKMDWAVADKLLLLAWEQKKELWLALPTTAKFGEEKQDFFRLLIPGSNLVLANMAELARITGVINAHTLEEHMTDAQKQRALEALQQRFNDKSAEILHKPINPHRQVGFITHGINGAYIVTKNNIQHVNPPAISADQVVNTVGAGDTAFAGFAYGYLKNMSPDKAASIAMILAGEKLKTNSSRLADPLSLIL